jgi:hypothetical protein
MPCDTKIPQGMTIQTRAEEIRDVVSKIAAALASNRIKVTVGKKGGIAFNLGSIDRRNVTDGCIYRRIMSGTNAAAKMAIARAEALAGTPVNKQAVGQGLHSHDFGKTWHDGH